MPSGRSGSIHLFRFRGIDVFLHWSWFLIALFEINARAGRYTAYYWNVLEYLALFVIVLMHEFGHALACRQVGGNADHIVLWPLGGVAYVDAPPRPGATLWSLVAGPLVNVVLLPILLMLTTMAGALGWAVTMPNLAAFLSAVLVIDVVLLVFNILPIYPLDGGQILRSLLWFFIGRARSLLVAVVIGFLGVAAFFFFAFRAASIWLSVLGVFMLLNCWSGMKHALYLLKLGKIPRREGFACPWCKSAPPAGAVWRCANCGSAFDTFATQGQCPHCAAQFPVTPCLDCGHANPVSQWDTRTLVGKF